MSGVGFRVSGFGYRVQGLESPPERKAAESRVKRLAVGVFDFDVVGAHPRLEGHLTPNQNVTDSLHVKMSLMRCLICCASEMGPCFRVSTGSGPLPDLDPLTRSKL